MTAKTLSKFCNPDATRDVLREPFRVESATGVACYTTDGKIAIRVREDVPGVWYTDGVNHFYLGEDYTIGEDGLAYDGNGRVFGAGWAPDTAYDPSVDWGEGWSDSWD